MRMGSRCDERLKASKRNSMRISAAGEEGGITELLHVLREHLFSSLASAMANARLVAIADPLFPCFRSE